MNVDGASLYPTAVAWRNFQPGLGAPTDDRLYVEIRLWGNSGAAVPAGVRPRYVWMLHGQDKWSAELGVARVDWNGTVSALANGGPTWAVMDSIQVVTGLQDSTGALHIVRCPDTPIVRVD